MILAVSLALLPFSQTEAPALLDRVAVVGASVSDGFMLNSEFGVDVDFADFLTAALPGRTALSLGSNRMFMDPHGVARQMVDDALKAEPTLVVAVDFLFWFGYGYAPGADARVANLDRGLAYLTEFDCPVVIGDFPDMTPALEGTSPLGPLLAPAQIPDTETLARLNQRVQNWVRERESALLISLDAFTQQQRAGHPVDVRGNHWEGRDIEGLLQDDLLHPTVLGTTILALRVLDAVVTKHGLEDTAIVWDATALHTGVQGLKRAELDKKAERDRKREERRKKREERKAAG